MNDIEKHYVRTFCSSSGKQVLSHLRSLTKDRVLGPCASNEEIRWWAAQNALVYQIENLIKRGNNPT